MKALILAVLAAAAPAAAWGRSLNGPPSASLLFETESTGKPEIDNRLSERAVEVLRRRLNAFGLPGTVERLESGRIAVTLGPGVRDVEGMLRPLLKPGRLEFRLAFPDLTKAGPGQTTVDDLTLDPDTGRLLRTPRVVEKKIRLTGAVIKSAAAAHVRGQPSVNVEFDAAGAAAFAAVTRASVGRALAIVLDGRLLSAPVIQTEIAGGRLVINGNFTEPDARDFARLLSSGELAPGLKLVQKTIAGKELPLVAPAAPRASRVFIPRGAKAPTAPAEAPAPVSDVDEPPPALVRGTRASRAPDGGQR